MRFKSMTEPDMLLGLIPSRIEEFNMMHRDTREHLSLVFAEPSELRIRVCNAREEAASTDLVAKITADGEGGALLSAELQKKASGRKRFFAVLYGLVLAGLARLTVLALLYGAVLGISRLVGGKSFLLAAIPSIVLALGMTFSALRVAFSTRRRVASFFTAYLGCTELSENA